MSNSRDYCSTQENAQQLEDWEILDEVSSARSMSPILVPTPPPPPPPPYSHLPAWLYTQICQTAQQTGETVVEASDKPIFVARPISKVRNLEEPALNVHGFEDVPLENLTVQKQLAGMLPEYKVLHSSASLNKLVGNGSHKKASGSLDSLKALTSDLKISKSLSDLPVCRSARDLISVPETVAQDSAPLTILLMGDTVESWAAVGNKIIGLNVFASQSHNSYQPLRLQRASVTRNNTRITLVTLPVLNPQQPLPSSLKSQLTSLLRSGVDAVLIAGGWYGGLEDTVDALLTRARAVVGDEAAEHVLMLLRKQDAGCGVTAVAEDGGEVARDAWTESVIQQAATRVMSVRGWQELKEQQIDKVVDMAYKLSINQGRLQLSSSASIPIQKWPELPCDSIKDRREYARQQSGKRCKGGCQQDRISRLLSKAGRWFDRFTDKFNCVARWAIIAGFGATLASIFAAPLFGLGGNMMKPVLEIVNLTNYDNALQHNNKNRIEVATAVSTSPSYSIYH